MKRELLCCQISWLVLIVLTGCTNLAKDIFLRQDSRLDLAYCIFQLFGFTVAISILTKFFEKRRVRLDNMWLYVGLSGLMLAPIPWTVRELGQSGAYLCAMSGAYELSEKLYREFRNKDAAARFETLAGLDPNGKTIFRSSAKVDIAVINDAIGNAYGRRSAEMANRYSFLGYLFSVNHNDQESEKWFQKSQTIAESNHDSSAVVEALSNRAAEEWFLGDNQGTRQLLDEATSLRMSLGNSIQEKSARRLCFVQALVVGENPRVF